MVKDIQKTIALAIFVKTPKLSPIKTRLASTIGKIHAEKFYILSVKAVESIVVQAQRKFPLLMPYWSVAEKEGLSNSLWKNFPQICQGEGSLGERFFKTYETLKKKHYGVILAGADSPQISSFLLIKAAKILLESKKCVLGKAYDGGFYLFGGGCFISKKIWMNVPYSVETTAKVLQTLLDEEKYEIQKIKTLLDIDILEDLKRYAEMKIGKITPEQHTLLEWSKQF